MPSGSIKVGLRLDTNRFRSGLNQATRNAQGFSRRLSGFLRGTGIVAAGGVIANALTGAAGAVKGFAIDAVSSAKNVSVLASRLRIGAQEAQLLQRAAEISGVSLGEFESSVISLQDKIAAANSGNAEAIKFFEKLGLTAEELKFANPIAAFTRVTNAAFRFSRSFNSVNEEQAELRKLLGPNAQSLIQFTQSIGQASTELEKFADDKTIKNLTEISNAFGGIATALKTAFQKDLSNLLEVLNLDTDTLSDNPITRSIEKKGILGATLSAPADIGSFLGNKAATAIQESRARGVQAGAFPGSSALAEERAVTVLEEIAKNTRDPTISR